MTSNEAAAARYDAIADELAPRGAHRSQTFGMPCLKDVNGKAFAGLRGGRTGVPARPGVRGARRGARPGGAHLFDPAGGRPMKDRVCLPGTAADRWQRYAEAALAAPR